MITEDAILNFNSVPFPFLAPVPDSVFRLFHTPFWKHQFEEITHNKPLVSQANNSTVRGWHKKRRRKTQESTLGVDY